MSLSLNFTTAANFSHDGIKSGTAPGLTAAKGGLHHPNPKACSRNSRRGRDSRICGRARGEASLPVCQHMDRLSGRAQIAFVQEVPSQLMRRCPTAPVLHFVQTDVAPAVSPAFLNALTKRCGGPGRQGLCRSRNRTSSGADIRSFSCLVSMRPLVSIDVSERRRRRSALARIAHSLLRLQAEIRFPPAADPPHFSLIEPAD